MSVSNTGVGNNIKVSVVMPVYNAYEYLRDALNSITSQTLREIEIICVDDGSTDRSLDILKEMQKADDRIRIITENNAGPSIARNKGLARVRGEFVIFFDADDFCEPKTLEKLYDLALRDELDIAVVKYDIYNNRKGTYEGNIKCDHGEIFDTGKPVSKNDHPDEIFQCTTGYVWNKLYRTSFIKEKELSFDPELRVFEDTYFVITSLSLADRVGKVQEVLIHHRVYSEQAKNKLFKKYYSQVPEIYLRLKNFLTQRGMLIPLSRSFLNLAASRSYKIYNLLWRDAKEAFWNMYHTEYAKKLGWETVNPEDFESDEVRDFVASMLLYDHKHYVKREDKGAKVKINKVGKTIKHKQSRAKIKSFFGRIFRRKKHTEN